MGPLVLVIDDERFPMQYYITVLQNRGFEVIHVLDPDSALKCAAKHGDAIAVIVLDCMMPPGRAYENEETDEGIRTGVLLLHDLRLRCPEVPVVVLTNVSDRETLAEFSEGPCLKVVQKIEWPPNELADLVETMTGAPEPRRSSQT